MSAFFRHMLRDEVEVEPVTLNSDGSVTGGTKTTAPAYVRPDVTVESGDAGSAADVVTVVYMDGDDVDLEESDRIHLPDGDVMEVKQVTKDTSVLGTDTLIKAMG